MECEVKKKGLQDLIYTNMFLYQFTRTLCLRDSLIFLIASSTSNYALADCAKLSRSEMV